MTVTSLERRLQQLVERVERGTGAPSPTERQQLTQEVRALKLAIAEGSITDPLQRRTFHEVCVALAVRTRDWTMFERHMAQLAPLYADERLQPSPRRDAIIGLNLMRLLAQNRLAEFHMEMELLPVNERSRNPCVQFPVQVEQALVEGRYRRILQLDAPPEWRPFLELLRSTTRAEALSCAAAAYDALPLPSLSEMVGVPAAELSACLAQTLPPGTFAIEDGVVRLTPPADGEVGDGGGGGAQSARALLQRSLEYAQAWERIV